MADAEVGDDVYGEDPTVNRLRVARGRRCSARKPRSTCRRARWRTSSRSACSPRPGTEVLCPDRVARVPLRSRGRAAEQRRADAPAVGRARRHRDRDRRHAPIEFPPPSMLVLENTYMAMSGAPIGADEMRTLVRPRAATADCACTSTARASGTRRSRSASPPRELVGGADTVMFCLSKGLGAPVGSLLCGPADVIAEARAQRARLGRRDAPGRRDRGRGHRRARDDGRAARRRPRPRPHASPTRSPSAGRAASTPRPSAPTSCARELDALPERLRRAARRRSACACGTIDPAHGALRHAQGRRRRRRSPRTIAAFDELRAG